MDKTTEFRNEILQLIEMAKTYISFDGEYLEHYRTIESKYGYMVLLDNNCRLFINKGIVDAYIESPSNITNEDLKKIALSLNQL